MKRMLVLLIAFAVVVNALVLVAVPATAELPECDIMPITYIHAHDFQGWGDYLVSLGWGVHPDAYQYRVTLAPPGQTFGPTPVGWNWLSVSANLFRNIGAVSVTVVALDAAGNELCYTTSAVGPLGLTAWNPPEAPKPPLPIWLRDASAPLAPASAAPAPLITMSACIPAGSPDLGDADNCCSDLSDAARTCVACLDPGEPDQGDSDNCCSAASSGGTCS